MCAGRGVVFLVGVFDILRGFGEWCEGRVASCTLERDARPAVVNACVDVATPDFGAGYRDICCRYAELDMKKMGQTRHSFMYVLKHFRAQTRLMQAFVYTPPCYHDQSRG
jgi:hypothetical protein